MIEMEIISQKNGYPLHLSISTHLLLSPSFSLFVYPYPVCLPPLMICIRSTSLARSKIKIKMSLLGLALNQPEHFWANAIAAWSTSLTASLSLRRSCTASYWCAWMPKWRGVWFPVVCALTLAPLPMNKEKMKSEKKSYDKKKQKRKRKRKKEGSIARDFQPSFSFSYSPTLSLFLS